MSSVTPQQYFTANLDMLGHGLATTDVFDVPTTWCKERRGRYRRVLTDAFQDEMTSDAELANNLLRQCKVLHAAPSPNGARFEATAVAGRTKVGQPFQAAGQGCLSRLASELNSTVPGGFTGQAVHRGTEDMEPLTDRLRNTHRER